jgi:hypothetical protein
LADGGVQVAGNDSIDWQQAMLRQAQRGDVRAFERLYRDTIGRVHGVCLRLTRDPALAEDCTQERTCAPGKRCRNSRRAAVSAPGCIASP